MKIIAEASPNIALIKYWGKKTPTSDLDRNIGLNPSVSFTLSRAKTRVEINDAPDLSVSINDQVANPTDREKVLAHAQRVHSILYEQGLVAESQRPFQIVSRNNFPSGTGMASSASSFAALTMAFLGHELGIADAQKLLHSDSAFVSSLARRGSGSAARSLFPWAYWEGPAAAPLESSWKLFDTVVIFSKQHKKYPSSVGHQAALQSPLLAARLQKLPQRIERVLKAIEEKSLARLGPLIEEEALEMHEVALHGEPSIQYLSEDSRRFLAALRKLSGRDFYFTADAGPNLHLISERPIESELLQIMAAEGLTADIWPDSAGSGPTLFPG